MPRDNTYYDLLGIPRNADKKAIKKAYRKMAMKYHPDRAEESKKKEHEEKFKEISEAFQILSDEKKRKIYDQYGKDGMKNGGYPGGAPGGSQWSTHAGTGGSGWTQGTFGTGTSGFQFMNAEDLFSQHMGGFDNFASFFQQGNKGSNGGNFKSGNARGNFTQQPPGPPRGRAGGHRPFGASDDMFTFSNAQFGDGFASANPTKVHKHDAYVSLEDLYKQKTKKIRMTTAAGKKKLYSFKLRPGVNDGTHVTFQAEDGEDFDVQFTIRIKDDPRYKKDGSDIIYTHNISLTQALLGGTFTVPLLSGGQFTINLNNRVIHPEYIYKIGNEGLPGRKNPGNLIVKFKINFPTHLTPQQRRMVSDLRL